MRHVSINRPLDFAQWNLDGNVRSVRIQVDKDNDMYCLPVIVVDPTRPLVKAVSPTPINTWEWLATSVTVVATSVHIPAAGFTTFLDQYEISWMGDTMAAGAANFMLFLSPTVGILHDVGWWSIATAAYKEPYTCTLKYPLEYVDELRVQLFAALTSGNVGIHIWGHDEAIP